MSARAESRRPLRAAVIGVSSTRTCGVRDHASLLAAALGAEDVVCSRHWLSRSDGSIADGRATFKAWSEELETALREERPDAVVLHYSVFSYAHRGIPLFVHRALAAPRAAGTPLVTVLHEYAYPWRFGGPRGAVWAVTQRTVLLDVMRASAGVLVTAPARAEWLSSRRWLPSREIAFAPVFANLPSPSASADAAQREGHVAGLFGYAYEGADRDLVLDALGILRDADPAIRLRLLGAPGADGPAAEAWLAGARSRGLEQALSFSGVLAAQDLIDELAGCDVLLHPEPSGPTSRKGTLAGSLASGRPVVALDGPRSWRELRDREAALIVAPRAAALADGVASLLRDRDRADQLGARGREFAEREMGVQRSARAVRGLLDSALSGSPREQI